VATFVSAHTFCASRKACFKRHARAGVGIDAIDYTTKYTAKMKAKSAVATILLLKTYQKWFLWCHLPCSFVICIRIFAFLYVKASSVKKYPVLPFSENADVSIFVEIQG